jgi:hypothetical protein
MSDDAKFCTSYCVKVGRMKIGCKLGKWITLVLRGVQVFDSHKTNSMELNTTREAPSF